MFGVNSLLGEGRFEPDYHQNQWGLFDVLFSNYFEELVNCLMKDNHNVHAQNSITDCTQLP